MSQTPWTDDTIMPWGNFKGTAMRDVPDVYKLWLLQQRWLPDWPGLFSYLKSIESGLRAAAKDLSPSADQQPDDLQGYEDYLRDYRGF